MLGNLWVTNSKPRLLADGSALGSVIELSPGAMNDYSQVTEFDVQTAAGTTPPYLTGMALDGDNPAHIFASDFVTGRIFELDGGTPGVQANAPIFVSPGGGYPGPLAIDNLGNVWTADVQGGASELVVGSTGFAERDLGSNVVYIAGQPNGVAADGAGHIWIANTDASANKGLVELDSSGSSLSAITALGAFNGASTTQQSPFGGNLVGTNPLGVAIDRSGNVWVATGNVGGVVEIIGAAVPVRTPLLTRASLP
jgi:sugar lactone lactonase YvrE